MNDITFDQIARMVQQPAGDISMNRKTWDEFRERYWPGRATVPPGAVRVWIDNQMGDGECRPGVPNTGYRAR